MFLFTLENDQINEVNETQYLIWEASIPADRRTALGMLVRRDLVALVKIVTFFSGTPLGFDGHSNPLLFATIAAGDHVWMQERFATQEAATIWHELTVRQIECEKGEKRDV